MTIAIDGMAWHGMVWYGIEIAPNYAYTFISALYVAIAVVPSSYAFGIF